MKKLMAGLVLIGSLAANAVYGAAVTDVTFNGENADAVAGHFNGNDTAALVNAQFGGDPFSALLKFGDGDTGLGSVAGVDFVLTAGSGVWNLSWSGPGLPLTMDFVFVVKAANDWAAWLFEAVTFTSSELEGEGTYVITWLNNGGRIPNLSHASMYVRVLETVEVPEPSVLLLMGMGLLGLGLRRRNRKNALAV